MGFIDMSGALGRHFGSIGVALQEIYTQVTLKPASHLQVSGASSDRALKITRQLCQTLDVSDAVAIDIDAAIPEHIGLGSGTQMALAIGAALNAYYDLSLSVREIARLADRGARSGIGIGVFEQGGLVVDGGRGPHTLTPPLLTRMAVPEDWRFILVFDERGQGLHGEQEVTAFRELPPFPRQEAERLCYLLLMQGLPALAEQDLIAFGEVISALQDSVGQHFAPVQGGVFTSQPVAEAMAWLQQQGAVGIGQTSWGPTGFCAVATPLIAEILLKGLQQRFESCHLSFKIVSARNQPAFCVTDSGSLPCR
jgi:beta-RFAP synthase